MENSLSFHEQTIWDMGQQELASLMLALRLQNPYSPESPEYLLWNDQCQINVPLLIHACLYLDAFCKKHGKKRILFSARDCCLWIQLFKTLYPEYESLYFHSSRWVYQAPSESFIEYVKNIYTDEAIITDAYGSGNSCSNFFQRRLDKKPDYLAIVKSEKDYHGIIRTPERYMELEKMNYDLVGSLYDVEQGKPLRAQPEYNLQYVYPSHLCVEKCKEIVSCFKITKFSENVIRWAWDTMNKGIAIAQYIDHAEFHYSFFHKKIGWKHVHQVRTDCFFEVDEQGKHIWPHP